MRCKFCGFTNGEDDHRCLRCGRRSAGVVIAAPASYSGANALAVAPAVEIHASAEFAPASSAAASPALQPALFPPAGQKVIPFDQLQRHVTGKLNLPLAVPPPVEKPVRPAAKKPSAPTAEQTTLDFFRAAASAPRTRKTAVPAQIYCDLPVASPVHRLVAGAMDAAMILLAFGLFVEVAQLAGGAFGEGRLFWPVMGVSFALICLFYGALWLIAGRESAGMNWAELRLVTFDGFPVEGRIRVARFASSWLSFCAVAAGVLWTMADEESLAWHDHMSRTFPTVRETPGSFHRHRT